MRSTGRWLAGALLIGAGCNAMLGVEPLPGGQVSFASAECTACMDAHCAAEGRACVQSEPCRPLFECLAGCGLDEAPCRAACRDAHELAITKPEAVALDSCQRDQCLDECLGSGGLTTAFGEACTECVDRVCSDDMRACVADADCDQVVTCLAGCTNPECVLECFYAPEIGDNEASSAMNDCLLECPAECNTGRHWNCVDDFSWGVKPAGVSEVDFSLQVGSLLKKDEPPVGVDVTPCLGVFEPCRLTGEPAVVEVVDGKGRASLTLEMQKFGWEGYFFLSGERQTEDPTGEDPPVSEAIMPQLFFLGRPVTRGETRPGTQVFTEQEYRFFAGLAGVQLADGLGHLGVIVWDCLWGEAPGVQVSVNDEAKEPGQTTTLYVRQGSWLVVDDDGSKSTDSSGGAAIVNLEPGPVEVTVTRAADDKTLSTYTVLVAEKSVTTLFAMANPLEPR